MSQLVVHDQHHMPDASVALAHGALHPCEQLYEVEMVFTSVIIITEYKVAIQAAHKSALADYNS